MAALVGGGINARPGEVSLAHHGVLFLDELPEFQPQVLDSLRQPLEAGEILIARANHRVTYPARFQLVAAMNPCRCGQATEPGFVCRRQPNERCMAQYQARMSGPLLDRIDLSIEVPAVTAVGPHPAAAGRRLGGGQGAGARGPRSAGQTLRRSGARRHRHQRGLPGAADRAGRPARRRGPALIHDAANAMRLSARGFHRVLKVARTLADLDGEEKVRRIHLAEALSYRAHADRRPNAA